MLDGKFLLLLSASPFTSMMQEVLLTKCVVSARMCMSELHVVPLQADTPDILIPESSGGLSHISGLVEDVPFHGGEELTTGMMNAFIPVAMKSLLKVCLGLECDVL